MDVEFRGNLPTLGQKQSLGFVHRSGTFVGFEDVCVAFQPARPLVGAIYAHVSLRFRVAADCRAHIAAYLPPSFSRAR
jgi:hypothetical protein